MLNLIRMDTGVRRYDGQRMHLPVTPLMTELNSAEPNFVTIVLFVVNFFSPRAHSSLLPRYLLHQSMPAIERFFVL